MGLRLLLPLILGLSILAASFSAEAAIAFRSKVFDLEPGGFNIDPGEPAGAQADDILIYWMIVQDTFGTITGPTGGWTLIHKLMRSRVACPVFAYCQVMRSSHALPR